MCASPAVRRAAVDALVQPRTIVNAADRGFEVGPLPTRAVIVARQVAGRSAVRPIRPLNAILFEPVLDLRVSTPARVVIVQRFLWASLLVCATHFLPTRRPGVWRSITTVAVLGLEIV